MKTTFRLSMCRLLATVSVLITVHSASAVDLTVPVVRVEEDWVAYIRNPDANLGAPQITNVIAPKATTEGAFGMVELNHGSQPDFRSGGYQVQSWIGEIRNDHVFSEESAVLRYDYDKLVYTVAMEISETSVSFTLKDGRSRTWGRFAQHGVTAMAPASGLTLQDYDPQFSVDNTTVNVGAHRVALLYQRETRYYSAAGLEVTDNTPRILHRFKNVVQFVSLQEYEQRQDYFNIEITE
ncbi:MAG: hypothetical protein RIK87_25115 [Fuerstiella sp.]